MLKSSPPNGLAPAGRAAAAARTGTGYIAGPAYDLFFFIGAPLLSLPLILLIVALGWHGVTRNVFGLSIAPVAFLISAWTYAHLAAVGFRSHLNPLVFGQFRRRLIVVPILIFLGMMSSVWVFVTGFVLAAFWDVYHTSMQNFGFCRLYDMKRGNDPHVGRGLDIWLNHFAYIGPIFVGASLRPTIEPLVRFEEVLGWSWPRQVGDFLYSYQHVASSLVVLSGLVFLMVYVLAYARMARTGYRYPWQKLALVVSTATTSIAAWAYLPPFEAFFSANFFHALQYFGIVWWTERVNIRRLLRLERVAAGGGIALAVYVAILSVVGSLYAAGSMSGLRWAIALAVMVSLTHFWCDGFVWSVRRREVHV